MNLQGGGGTRGAGTSGVLDGTSYPADFFYEEHFGSHVRCLLFWGGLRIHFTFYQ